MRITQTRSALYTDVRRRERDEVYSTNSNFDKCPLGP